MKFKIPHKTGHRRSSKLLGQGGWLVPFTLVCSHFLRAWGCSWLHVIAGAQVLCPERMAFSVPRCFWRGREAGFVFACFSALFVHLVKLETMEGNVSEAFLYPENPIMQLLYQNWGPLWEVLHVYSRELHARGTWRIMVAVGWDQKGNVSWPWPLELWLWAENTEFWRGYKGKIASARDTVTEKKYKVDGLQLDCRIVNHSDRKGCEGCCRTRALCGRAGGAGACFRAGKRGLPRPQRKSVPAGRCRSSGVTEPPHPVPRLGVNCAQS